MSQGDQPSRKAKLLTLCLAAGYLLAVAMSVCPELHHWLHADCDESSHHCAVTALLDGQIDSASLAPLAVAYVPVQLGTTDCPLLERSLPLFLAGFALEHAPPAA